MSRKKDDFDIGYGKPPVHSRFQKGKSGNPSGKRARDPTINELIIAELNKKIGITENGKPRLVTKLQAMAKKCVNQAIQGDHRAQKRVMEAMQEKDGSSFPGDGPFHFTLNLEEDDREIGGPQT